MTPAAAVAAADLAFLAPGLVHHFGNLLFALQGHLLQADPRDAAASLAAIAGNVDRGAVALRVWRHLLGDGGPEPAHAGRTLRELAELARIGAREAGHRLDADGCEAAELVVDLAAFVPAVVTALRECLAAVPSGVPCCATLSWSGGGAQLAIDVRAEPGNLPFPFPGDAVLVAWERRGIARNWPYHGLRRSHGMAFSLPAANLSRP